MKPGIVWAPYVPLNRTDLVFVENKKAALQKKINFSLEASSETKDSFFQTHALDSTFILIKLMLKEIYYKHCLGNNFNFKKSELESRYQKTIFNSNFYTTIKIENNE